MVGVVLKGKFRDKASMKWKFNKKLMTLLTMVLERAKDVFACKTIGSTAKPIRDNTNHS